MKISILLLLFISMIQIPAHAGLYDYFTRLKQNIATRFNSYRVSVWRKELNTIADDCNADEKAYWTPRAKDIGQLEKAIANNHQATMQQLLKFDADPNSLGFMAAAKTGKIDIVKILLDHDANPNYACEGYSHVFAAAMQQNQRKTAQLLLDRGADINLPQGCHYYGMTALHYACRTANYDNVKFLLDRGANVTVAADYQETPLHMIAHSSGEYPDKCGAIAKELINHGADIFIQNDEFDTPVHKIMRLCGRESSADSLKARHGRGIAYDQWLNNKKQVAQIFLYHACQKAPLSEILSKQNYNQETPVQVVQNNDDLRKFLEECEQKKPEALEELMHVGNEASTKILQMKKRSAERLAQAVLRCYDAHEEKRTPVEYAMLPPEILLRITKFKYGVND